MIVAIVYVLMFLAGLWLFTVLLRPLIIVSAVTGYCIGWGIAWIAYYGFGIGRPTPEEIEQAAERRP